MPGEVTDVQPEATADQVAPEQDIDLDSAASEAERRLAGEVPAAVEETTEVVVEEKVEPIVLEEPTETTEDHKERTKLGRKVAKLEETLGKLFEQNQLLLERVVTSRPEPAKEEEVEYVDLSTPEGLDKFLTQRELKRVQSINQDKIQYGLGYQTQVKEWAGKATEAEDSDATEIHKLLIGDTPFNVRYTSDPKADFERNLAKAEAHFYKQKSKTPVEKKSPLLNEKPRAPLAVGGDVKATVTPTNVKPLNISPEALEFAKSQGWDAEAVSKILAAPVPNSFVKGRR